MARSAYSNIAYRCSEVDVESIIKRLSEKYMLYISSKKNSYMRYFYLTLVFSTPELLEDLLS